MKEEENKQNNVCQYVFFFNMCTDDYLPGIERKIKKK